LQVTKRQFILNLLFLVFGDPIVVGLKKFLDSLSIDIIANPELLTPLVKMGHDNLPLVVLRQPITNILKVVLVLILTA
jgi:hypothetical protein